MTWKINDGFQWNFVSSFILTSSVLQQVLFLGVMALANIFVLHFHFSWVTWKVRYKFQWNFVCFFSPGNVAYHSESYSPSIPSVYLFLVCNLKKNLQFNVIYFALSYWQVAFHDTFCFHSVTWKIWSLVKYYMMFVVNWQITMYNLLL